MAFILHSPCISPFFLPPTRHYEEEEDNNWWKEEKMNGSGLGHLDGVASFFN
jgi:hypothetical protein